MKVKLLSRARLLAIPWTAAYQAPPSMGFSRQEYWSVHTIYEFICHSFFLNIYVLFKGFPGSSEDKASAYNAGDLGSIPGLGRSPGEGNGNPLQYSCLKNPTDRAAWQATVHRVAKSRTRLSDFTHTHTCTFWLHGVFHCCEWVFSGCSQRGYPSLWCTGFPLQ